MAYRIAPHDITSRGTAKQALIEAIKSKRAGVGIVGLGYVGLPLATSFSEAGYHTIGFEIDESKARRINENQTSARSPVVVEMLARKRLRATTDFREIKECDCIIICVPTPLTDTLDPDLSHIRAAVQQVKKHLRPGQLIVLESTTYPGCTDELLLAELTQTGLELDRDFFVAFSPERVDPGNRDFGIANTPRIVGGCSPDSAEAAEALYTAITPNVKVVSSTRVAETAKVLENTFRAVNIALVNEMALICREMDIDIWEVIDAAKTKPYGFMPFYPGPGVGGHCIPIDPAYLSWKGKQFGVESRFIRLAQQINDAMPKHVVRLVTEGLNVDGKPLRGARILLIGVAYKPDVDDMRESPALEIIKLLRDQQADVSYHDPFVARLDAEHASVALDDIVLQNADCVVIVTAHTGVDHKFIGERAKLIVDTRNVIPKDLPTKARVIRL
ncbi:MAG TPA: nucleotide sugar dehydrogenase [Candidatus Tumulicola sp.]|nr:nucleotide sugar dehydrogenase [Candidatus Tumulicola sp.]